jgi:predicted nucleic acid-binding protein
VLDRATELRARHGFKTADAIHLATAIAHDADTFLTADADFKRVPELRVVLVDPDKR